MHHGIKLGIHRARDREDFHFLFACVLAVVHQDPLAEAVIKARELPAETDGPGDRIAVHPQGGFDFIDQLQGSRRKVILTKTEQLFSIRRIKATRYVRIADEHEENLRVKRVKTLQNLLFLFLEERCLRRLFSLGFS
jgi:hypothetical protein